MSLQMVPALLKEALPALSPSAGEDLRDAYEMAERFYAEKRHVCGESLMEFTESATRLLLPFRPDSLTLMSSLLQFASSQQEQTRIEDRFGKRIPHIISSLAVLEKSCNRATSLTNTSLRRMTLVLSEDIQVLLIFLHNRWHLLEAGESLEAAKRAILAHEALNVFAPISARLGMYAVKYALETLSFELLVPDKAALLKREFGAVREKQGQLLTEGQRALKRLLSQAGKRVNISGREKHPYSIFRKMERKRLDTLTDLHDLFGVRILTEAEEDCYHILGIIHRTYSPIIHRMKDYIAFPKPNGYRSLHSTILGLNRMDPTMPVEIQIRTEEMEEEAEHGIAAHWNYKEGGTALDPLHRAWKERMQALRQLSLSPETKGDDTQEELREALSDRIYALTPQGDPIELIKGATPLDFAFSIHTDIGLHYRAARVNGFIVPIDHILENGDVVEIIKQKEQAPQKEWIDIVQTREARTGLRSYFRQKEPEHGKAVIWEKK